MVTKAWASVIVVLVLIRGSCQYRWVLLEPIEDDDICTNRKCDGRLHTVCDAFLNTTILNKYQFLNITANSKRRLINGHNGIRNKIAHEYSISNMLYLHWDKNLAQMARNHATTMKIETDACDYIYNASFTVGQNFGYIDKPPSDRWVSIVMRKWFVEARHLTKGDAFLSQRPLNFTQMVWPGTAYVGCGAARIFKGYFLVCNYSPAAILQGEVNISHGPPCTDCPLDRPTCSRVFRGLCGIDVKIRNSSNQINSNRFIGLVLMYCLSKYLMFL